MLFRGIPTREFAEPGKYRSSIGLADSNNGIDWVIRDESLEIRHFPEAHDLGEEDAGVIQISPNSNRYAVTWNNATYGEDGRIRVGIGGAIVKDNFETVESQTPVILESLRPGWMRAKGLALFPEELANGNRPFFVTLGADGPYDLIAYDEDHSLDDIFRLGESPSIITPEDVARMYVENIYLPNLEEEVASGGLFRRFLAKHGFGTEKTTRVVARRGPESGPSPLRVGEYFLHFLSGADLEKEPTWAVDAAVFDPKERQIVGYLRNVLTPDQYKQKDAVVGNVFFPKSNIICDGEKTDKEVWLYGGIGDVASGVAKGDPCAIVDRALDAGYQRSKYPH